MKKQYATLIQDLRTKKPLIHHITNYVTVNDCANATLAIGASPIMADALEEVAEIASISSALALNMGTLNKTTVTSMLEAGKAANAAGIPIVFDPVGAGASSYRNETSLRIVEELSLSVICGNISEIRFLSGLEAETKGVDASEEDLGSLEEIRDIAQALAKQHQCVVAITGAVDVISDGQRVAFIENGHPMMGGLTGTGCMCTSLIASFCGAAPTSIFNATVSALLSMGIAGEIAHDRAGEKGNGSFRAALHDALSQLDSNTLEKRAKLI